MTLKEAAATPEGANEMTDQRTNGETFTFRCIYCRETSVGGWDAKLPNDACWNKNTGKRHRWHNWKDITPVAR